MNTLLQILKKTTTFFQEKGIEPSRRMAEELLASTLKMQRLDLYLHYDKPLEEAELVKLRPLVARAAKGEPLGYILGEVDFLGAKIQIDPRALIPRPETEVLADKVVKELQNRGECVVWDLCTGSGCIAIGLKKALPSLQITGSDICDKALSLARENGEKNGVEIPFLQGDLFAPFAGKKADVIICNPPYISSEEVDSLDRSVIGFEPIGALISGETGMEIYERIQKEFAQYLKPNGTLFLEIGYQSLEGIQKLFPGAIIERDFANHPRFVTIRL